MKKLFSVLLIFSFSYMMLPLLPTEFIVDINHTYVYNIKNNSRF